MVNMCQQQLKRSHNQRDDCTVHTRILRETDTQGRMCNLVFKQILLVEEEDYRSVFKPSVVTD